MHIGRSLFEAIFVDAVIDEHRTSFGHVPELNDADLGELLAQPTLVGVDPGNRLHDLDRTEHGALLAVHELREPPLGRLVAELTPLLVTPFANRRCGVILKDRVGLQFGLEIEHFTKVNFAADLPENRVGVVLNGGDDPMNVGVGLGDLHDPVKAIRVRHRRICHGHGESSSEDWRGNRQSCGRRQVHHRLALID